MTTVPAHGADQAPRMAPPGHARDRRESPVPTAGMIATRVMELRKRRGLMIALIVLNIGFPAVFLLIRLLAHAFAPQPNPPAGGDQIFVVLAAGFLPTFGFIAALTVGCTAGSRDLTEGMFRHLVVTGRSRLALYARSPPLRSSCRCRDRLHDRLRGTPPPPPPPPPHTPPPHHPPHPNTPPAQPNPPAGGDQIFVVLAAGFLPTFGFIAALTVGCTAGSRDLTEGMFRHLVVTGRSRLALYLARIPAGLAIVVPLVAIGYTIVCTVCVFAAPAFIDDNNVNIPPGLSRAGFENWAGHHAEPVICSLGNGPVPRNVPCACRLPGRSRQSLPASPRPPRWKPWPSGSPGATTTARTATPRFSATRRSPS